MILKEKKARFLKNFSERHRRVRHHGRKIAAADAVWSWLKSTSTVEYTG
jgi:hypothetical protein